MLRSISRVSRRSLNNLVPAEHVETAENLISTCEKIVEKHVNPNIETWEKEQKMPLHHIFKKFGEAGLLGISHPEKAGGFGLPYAVNLAVAESYGQFMDHGSLPMCLGVQTDMATPALAEHGNEHLVENYLKPAIQGDMVSCIGVSEPHAGSDVSEIKSTARLSDCGKYYIINGGKIWTTNVTQADWMCMLVNTEADKGKYQNKSLIVVPLNSEGITISTKDMEKLGQKASDWGQTYRKFEKIKNYDFIHKIHNRNFLFIWKT